MSIAVSQKVKLQTIQRMTLRCVHCLRLRNGAV